MSDDRDGRIWEAINSLREDRATMKAQMTAQERESERLRKAIDRLTGQFNSAIKLGWGLLGGLCVNLALLILQLMRATP